jgi:hypothetical protein
MQVGYVLCSADLNEILCLTECKSSVEMVSIDSTKAINKSICLSDLTEIKSIYKKFRNKELVGELEVVNVARLYKKFY